MLKAKLQMNLSMDKSKFRALLSDIFFKHSQRTLPQIWSGDSDRVLGELRDRCGHEILIAPETLRSSLSPDFLNSPPRPIMGQVLATAV